jgi:hypothetical protein
MWQHLKYVRNCYNVLYFNNLDPKAFVSVPFRQASRGVVKFLGTLKIYNLKYIVKKKLSLLPFSISVL